MRLNSSYLRSSFSIEFVFIFKANKALFLKQFREELTIQKSFKLKDELTVLSALFLTKRLWTR
jgi:hypothetical protein